GTDTSSGGTGGASSSSGGGGGTGGQDVEGQHCEGGETVGAIAYFDGTASNCSGDHLEYDLPNPIDASVRAVVLPEPLLADVESAISIEISGGGPLQIELWGTDSECGTANELLWYADVAPKIHCAQFTPSMEHTHLLLVMRDIAEGNYVLTLENLGLCPGGSCPEPDGTAVGLGETLVAHQQAYAYGGGSIPRGYAAELGVWGRAYMLGASRPQEGETMEITTGIFNAPTPFEPYGDAYYCIGDGSTIANNGDDGFEVSLRNITRLGSCDELAG